jgi:hypothetical protein
MAVVEFAPLRAIGIILAPVVIVTSLSGEVGESPYL